MRVAYVSTDPGVPVFGRKGASVHVREMLRAFLRHGADVHLVTTRTGGAAPEDLAAVRLHALEAPQGDVAARERALVVTNEEVRAVLKGLGELDLVYERHALWSHAAMEHARSAGTPGVLEVNAPLVDEQARHRGLVDRAAAEDAARRAFAAARLVVAVSEDVARHVRSVAPDATVRVVPNAVDVDRFRPDLPATRPAPGRATVGFVGTLKPWHGVDLLAEAFRRLHARRPGTRLLVVGDGPEKATLVADARAHGWEDALDLVGAVDPDAVPGLLASMDVAVAPYADGSYFSPLKLREYMAAGLPVVATETGEAARLLRQDVDGVLVPPGDARALALALDALLSDQGRRTRLGAAARAAVLRSGHTWSRVAEGILSEAGARGAAP